MRILMKLYVNVKPHVPIILIFVINLNPQFSLLLSFKFRCQYKLLLYAFKALHGLAPSYLGVLIHFYKPARSLRS